MANKNQKEWAKRTAQSLRTIAESFEKQGSSDPESIHKIADQIRALATSIEQEKLSG
jgi:hypothetical protein